MSILRGYFGRRRMTIFKRPKSAKTSKFREQYGVGRHEARRLWRGNMGARSRRRFYKERGGVISHSRGNHVKRSFVWGVGRK